MKDIKNGWREIDKTSNFKIEYKVYLSLAACFWGLVSRPNLILNLSHLSLESKVIIYLTTTMHCNGEINFVKFFKNRYLSLLYFFRNKVWFD